MLDAQALSPDVSVQTVAMVPVNLTWLPPSSSSAVTFRLEIVSSFAAPMWAHKAMARAEAVRRARNVMAVSDVSWPVPGLSR